MPHPLKVRHFTLQGGRYPEACPESTFINKQREGIQVCFRIGWLNKILMPSKKTSETLAPCGLQGFLLLEIVCKITHDSI
jgi:hypothetical protein